MPMLSVVSLVLMSVTGQAVQVYTGPRISVKPVFYVPADARTPTKEQSLRFVRYLRIAQARYFEMLEGEDTFDLRPQVTFVKSKATIAEIKAKPNGAAEFVVNDLMARDHVNRWTCPYVYVALYVGTGSYPGGGGRPINGGHNLGGGIIILSAADLDTAPNFQSTLQHELGHGFGLPHVDVYGYDMLSNNSIMSYNPKHHTSFFSCSWTPGQLIPEDKRGFAENKWVFPHYKFDGVTDLPKGYALHADVTLGPMDLTLH